MFTITVQELFRQIQVNLAAFESGLLSPSWNNET